MQSALGEGDGSKSRGECTEKRTEIKQEKDCENVISESEQSFEIEKLPLQVSCCK